MCMAAGPDKKAIAEQKRQAQLRHEAEQNKKKEARKDRLAARRDAEGRALTSSLVRLAGGDGGGARSFFQPTGG